MDITAKKKVRWVYLALVLGLSNGASSCVAKELSIGKKLKALSLFHSQKLFSSTSSSGISDRKGNESPNKVKKKESDTFLNKLRVKTDTLSTRGIRRTMQRINTALDKLPKVADDTCATLERFNEVLTTVLEDLPCGGKSLGELIEKAKVLCDKTNQKLDNVDEGGVNEAVKSFNKLAPELQATSREIRRFFQIASVLMVLCIAKYFVLPLRGLFSKGTRRARKVGRGAKSRRREGVR